MPEPRPQSPPAAAAGPEDRRERILDAAARVFSMQGYQGASIRMIAREAGLKSPGHVYRYFPSKARLLDLVLARGSDIGAQLHAVEADPERPPERALSLIARGYLRAFDDETTVRILKIVMGEAPGTPEVGADVSHTLRRISIRILEDYLRHQIDRGRLRPHQTQVAATALFATLIGYIQARELFPHLFEGLPGIDDFVDEVLEIFLDGLRPRG